MIRIVPSTAHSKLRSHLIKRISVLVVCAHIVPSCLIDWFIPVIRIWVVDMGWSWRRPDRERKGSAWIRGRVSRSLQEKGWQSQHLESSFAPAVGWLAGRIHQSSCVARWRILHCSSECYSLISFFLGCLEVRLSVLPWDGCQYCWGAGRGDQKLVFSWDFKGFLLSLGFHQQRSNWS